METTSGNLASSLTYVEYNACVAVINGALYLNVIIFMLICKRAKQAHSFFHFSDKEPPACFVRKKAGIPT